MPSRIGGRLLSDWEKGPPTVIGGKAYERVAVYPSSSDAGKEYTVCEVNDGTLSCDCMGWTRRNPSTGRTCKHVEDYDMFLRQDKGKPNPRDFLASEAETVSTSKPKKPVEGGALGDLFDKLEKGGL